MKQKKIVAVSFFMAFFSIIVFLCSFFFEDRTMEKGVESALVNPKNKEKIYFVEFSKNAETLLLKKNENFWYCSGNGIFTFADEEKIEKFLSALTEIRTVYKVLDSERENFDMDSFQISNFRVSLFSSSGEVLGILYFGKTDSLTSRIIFSSKNGRIVFETEDDFSSFLNMAVDFWVKMEIFFGVKNPSNLNFSPDNLHLLYSLRHGKTKSLSELPAASRLVNGFTVYGQFQDYHSIEIYEYESNGRSEYFYRQNVSSSKEEDRAFFELSGITYMTLCNLLNEQRK